MTYKLHHVHLKSSDPKKTADWYVKAFNFTIVSDDVRSFGDRFIRCKPEEGDALMMISGPKTGETLGPGSPEPRYGLEHFGIECDDIAADIKRLSAAGAELAEGPTEMPNGVVIAFLRVPGDVRLELLQRKR